MSNDNFLPLPRSFDTEQMWNALKLLNRGSHTWTAKLQRTLYQSYLTGREAGMGDPGVAGLIKQGQQSMQVANMPEIERAIAQVVSHKV